MLCGELFQGIGSIIGPVMHRCVLVSVLAAWVVWSVFSVAVGCVSVCCSSGWDGGGGGSWRLVYCRGGDTEVLGLLWVILWGDLGLFSALLGGVLAPCLLWDLYLLRIFVVFCVIFRKVHPSAFHPVPAFPFSVKPTYVPFMVFSLAFNLLLSC